MYYDGDMNGDNGVESGVCSKETTPLKGSRVSSSRLSSQRETRKRKLKERCTSFFAIVAAVLALCVGVALFLSDTFRGWYETFNGEPETPPVPQQYDELGRYIVEDYDATPAFADFLPGLAGIYGKPLYAFYTNRGQGIASFGIKSKDFPILEFQPANKAYQNTALIGFRTFLQGRRGNNHFVTEPFGALTTRFADTMGDYAFTATTLPAPYFLPKRYMFIGPNEMQIREVDIANHVETNVTYFILPEEDFGAFVRRTTITNTAKKGEPLVLSALDGLARMEPAGGRLDGYLKDMGKTLEGFMNVYSPYKNAGDMPFYRLSSQPSDTEATTAQIAGHYCLAMIEGDPSSTLLPIIYDPSKVFGDDTAMIRPVHLMSRTVKDIIREPQYGAAITPSAFAAVDSISLKPGESVTITSFYGKTSDMLDVPVIARRVLQSGFGPYKESRVREIVKQITAQIETKTAHELFDGHIKQMFLDSSINGGVPTLLGEVDDDALMRNVDEDGRLKVFHLFSRIHGDLERDYNDFKVSPTFFSEGPGRFNDLAQHRRNDVYIVPRVASFNVRMFLSLIQADGYNPHTVESVAFTISDKITCDEIALAAVGQADGHRAQREALSNILNGGPFRPGQLFELMSDANVELIIPIHNFVDMVAAAAELYPMGVYESGFWADHFTYIMDFIDSYLAVYPDQEERLLFEQQLKYFYSPASVQPRHRKYVLSLNFDGIGKHVRQLSATVDDQEKLDFKRRYFSKRMGWYDLEASWQHDSNAEIFESTPMEKLVLLATLKFSTRDPYGMGIEYEAGKPGYNSAMNGIPSMLGSGVAEAYELLRLLRYLVRVAEKIPRPIRVPVELNDLMESVNASLKKLLEKESALAAAANLDDDDDDDDGFDIDENLKQVPHYRFVYWDRVASAREVYRERVRVTFNGATAQIDAKKLQSTLEYWISEVEKGLSRGLAFGTLGEEDDGTSGLAPTYFSYNVTKWKRTGEYNSEGHPYANATRIVLNRFPLFLEGPIRMLQTASYDEARDIYQKVRQSPLRDKELGMYTISASLRGQNLDIGRVMAFAPGWLENQSVWMQLSYSFYKQLLSNDMYQEFFSEMQSGGMLPFMDPEVYGRSLMECSAFVASSAFKDPAKQGRGFYARFSGATSEFLMMWVRMFIGKEPFSLDPTTGQLQMQLIPALPQWLFVTDGAGLLGAPSDIPTITYKLFGSIDVRYYNERGGDLFNIPPYRYVVGYRDGSSFEVQGPVIPVGLADKIRRVVFVASIDVFFH